MPPQERADEYGNEDKRPKYFTPREVAMHNLPEDCWVSLFHRVLNLSDLIRANRGEDISHWFDPITQDLKKHVDPERNIVLPFLPHGRFLHVPPLEPSSDWDAQVPIPWWKDPRYIVGRLTEKTRVLEIVNVLTQQRDALEVCCEETIEEIQTRYLKYNSHAASYTWKCLDHDEFVPLNMHKTLAQNGIADESSVMDQLDLDELSFKPVIHLYFNDDLTIV